MFQKKKFKTPLIKNKDFRNPLIFFLTKILENQLCFFKILETQLLKKNILENQLCFLKKIF